MREDIQKRWVEKLRSGEYEQGTGYLRNDDKFCCLGVLCEMVKDELSLSVTKERIDSVVYHYGDDEASNYLPQEVREYAKITSSNPSIARESLEPHQVYREDAHQVSLAVLNDRGLTFKEIANLIEEAKYL